MVLGISMDGVDSHKQFCDKESLPYDLVADTDKKAHAAYGFTKPSRALILVDKSGKIAFANRAFKVGDKAQWEELYKAVDALAK